MKNLKTLTALLCQPLLSNPDSASFSRITINLPLRSISCAYRIVDGPGAYSALSFLSCNHCIGSSLMEYSDDSSEPPELLCWRSTAEFLNLHPQSGLKCTTSWKTLLDPFETVELIHAADSINLSKISDEKLSRSEFLDKFFLEPD